MNALPLLLLGGAALLIAGKKKSEPKTQEEEDVFVPDIPPRPEGEPDFTPGESASPRVGDVVDSGIRRDRTGAHNWRVILGDGGYIAQDLPIGAHGPKDDLGVAQTVAEAKKILADFYNAALADAGYPDEVKDDPGPRRLSTVSALRNR